MLGPTLNLAFVGEINEVLVLRVLGLFGGGVSWAALWEPGLGVGGES